MALGPELRFTGRTRVLFEGRSLLFFGGNDYHRLASQPEVIAAAAEAAATEGLGCAGSRITTGNHPLLVELERSLAGFLGAGEACLGPSGYLSNSMALDVLAAEFQRFFIDKGSHSSLAAAAARLPREAVHPFRHSDPEDLERSMRVHLRDGERPLVLTDGVVAGDGELTPLAAYWGAAKRQGGKLLVDDAHGIAVVGPMGKGSPEEAGLPAEAFIQAGTLSKGLGSFGGLVAGPAGLAAKVCGKSQTFIGGTGIPPPFAAAALRSLGILREDPGLVTRLRERVLRVRERVRAMGFRSPQSPAPILSITHGDAEKNRHLRGLLLEKGIYPPLIDYPGSPPGGHFRFTLSGAHTEGEVEMLLETLGRSVG